MKARVLLRYGIYRLTYNGHGYTRLEKQDGTDVLGVGRWYKLRRDEQTPEEFERVMDRIGDALMVREKRRRRSK